MVIGGNFWMVIDKTRMNDALKTWLKEHAAG